MAAITRQFNGTTITFDAVAVGQLTGISFSSSGAEIDTSDIDDAVTLYEKGQSDITLQLTITGSKSGTLAEGDEGAIVLTWADGTVVNIANSIITGEGASGTKNAGIVGTYQLRPTHPAT